MWEIVRYESVKVKQKLNNMDLPSNVFCETQQI